jgi:hypothetical protein
MIVYQKPTTRLVGSTRDNMGGRTKVFASLYEARAVDTQATHRRVSSRLGTRRWVKQMKKQMGELTKAVRLL